MGRPLKWQSNPYMQQVVARNRPGQEKLHWLELQKADRYQWQKTKDRAYYRRMGVVESLFDADGEYFTGRADLHQNFRVEIKTSLNNAELQERIILAWTLMRHRHVLLACTTAYLHELTFYQTRRKWTNKCFKYAWPASAQEAIEETKRQVKFVVDAYHEVDARDFFEHVRNTGRAINSQIALSGLYVMPYIETTKGTKQLHFTTILAHQITDGLTTFRWSLDLTRILNLSDGEIKAELSRLFDNESEMLLRLPPAQEALYPQRSHSKARQRWHWLVTRILRHIRNAPPAAFQNPLRRESPLTESVRFSPKYDQILDYSVVPPLTSGHIGGDLYGRPVENMRRLCKETGISIGSGLFTLVAMVMMEMEERRHPNTLLQERLAFVGSFPVNPRPFLNQPTMGKENSCMLAFSDGVTLPFFPRDLDFVMRFRVLGRLAHRQLRHYQKKNRSLEEELHLGSKSPSQLIPALFCYTVERMENRVPAEHKSGVNVQGSYPATVGPTLATCGISSVGDVSSMAPPKIELEDLEGKDLKADFIGNVSCVRPRDGEFLVGASGSATHLGFLVAYDANAIDPAKAEEWKFLMQTMLDRDLFSAPQPKL